MSFLIYHDESFYPISNPKGFTSLRSILEGFTLGSWRTEIDSFQGIKRAPRYAQKPYVFHPGKFAASLVVERIRWPRSKRPTTSMHIYVKYRYSTSSINRISICRRSFYHKIIGAMNDFRILPFLCYLRKLNLLRHFNKKKNQINEESFKIKFWCSKLFSYKIFHMVIYQSFNIPII